MSLTFQGVGLCCGALPGCTYLMDVPCPGSKMLLKCTSIIFSSDNSKLQACQFNEICMLVAIKQELLYFHNDFHTEFVQPSQQGLSTCLEWKLNCQKNQAAFSILHAIKSQECEINLYFPDEAAEHALSLSVRVKSPVICWILQPSYLGSFNSQWRIRRSNTETSHLQLQSGDKHQSLHF